MDINALNELIAQAREMTASVAQAEERVAALLTHPVIDRRYAQWPCLAGGSPFRNLQSSHGLRLIGVFAELLMEPFKIVIQTGLELRNGHLICAACPLIGANALPRKLQVLA